MLEHYVRDITCQEEIQDPETTWAWTNEVPVIERWCSSVHFNSFLVIVMSCVSDTSKCYE